ncbi:MAG: hypothetical protein ACRCTB_09275 [Vibrio sp.]
MRGFDGEMQSVNSEGVRDEMAIAKNEKGQPKLPFFDAALRGKINAIKR